MGHDDSLPRAAAVIENGIKQRLHLGAQLYVSRDGRTVADLALGQAREGVQMRSDMLMLWMLSIEPITAVAIAQMWERGKLDLDDRVARHVPEFAANGKERVTVRHVLTHTGGFPGAVLNWAGDPWTRSSPSYARRRSRRLGPGTADGLSRCLRLVRSRGDRSENRRAPISSIRS